VKALIDRSNRRWIAPAAAAGLVIASPALWAAVATAEPALPQRTAEQIIADVLAASPVALSGEVQQRVDLGLPDLTMGSGVDFTEPSSVWGLVSGTHTWRIWYDGDRSYRVSVIQGAAESDVICNGAVTWIWSSQKQTAIRDQAATGQLQPRGRLPIPQQSTAETARDLLNSITDYSAVTTDANVRVAGRAAYELVITPNDTQTRIKQVHLAVDAETSQPLRLQIYSTISAGPAIEIGYTQLSYSAPNASVFEFTPPPGAEIRETVESAESPVYPDDPASGGDRGNLPAQSGQDEATTSGASPTVSGAGWSTVLVVESGPLTDSSDGSMLARQLPRVSGDWGSGSVLDGSLISVVFADDGRIAYGAVAPESLYQALR